MSSLFASIQSLLDSLVSSSSFGASSKELFYNVIQFLNLNSNNDATAASLVFNLILVYVVVFIVVFVLVVTYRFYSNFIHLTSCLDHITDCHVEQNSNKKLGTYATVLIGSGQHTRNSAIVGLLYTRVRVYIYVYRQIDFLLVGLGFFLISHFLCCFIAGSQNISFSVCLWSLSYLKLN